MSFQGRGLKSRKSAHGNEALGKVAAPAVKRREDEGHLREGSASVAMAASGEVSGQWRVQAGRVDTKKLELRSNSRSNESQ